MNDLVIMNFPPFFNKKQIESINIVKPDILLFDEEFRAELNNFILPDSIFYISFGNNFNKSLNYVVLPKYLKKLKLSDVYSQSLNYVSLPETLEILNLGKVFNNSLFSVKFPKNLKELILNDKFNTALPSVLPDTLEKLILGKEFDFSINNFVVPQKLKYIKINGRVENKVLFKNLPKTIESIEVVEYLYFKYHFDFPLLETLVIPYNSNEITINNKECKKLKYIKCTAIEHNHKFINNLPDSVKKLEIINSLCVDLINLPDSLEELFINIKPTIIHDIRIGNFAFNLNNLNNQNHPVAPVPDYPEYYVKQTNLPITLKTLKLYDEKLLKFFDKIPYDCNVVYMNIIPIKH
jgi:hypothetical protein